MNSSVDQQIKQSELLCQQGKHRESFEAISKAYNEAWTFLSDNRHRVRNIKQANLFLADLSERTAMAADRVGDREANIQYCNNAISLLERYRFAGESHLFPKVLCLYSLRDGAAIAAGNVLCQDQMGTHPVARAFDAMDEATDCFKDNDFRSAYQHLQLAVELLYTEAVINKHEMHMGTLFDCYVRMLETKVFGADPNVALQECKDMRCKFEELIADGQLQYSRFQYFSWFYQIFAMAKSGLLREAFDESILLRAALRDEVCSNGRDDLAPLKEQIEQDILTCIKPN